MLTALRILSMFQFTPSRGGRPQSLGKALMAQQKFQFTPSRGGRRVRDRVFGERTCVSIHALARRATIAWSCNCYDENVSIHALARRATSVEEVQDPLDVGFNSRPRAEGDFSARKLFDSVSSVSIHALARRATRRRYRTGRNGSSFNSRPRAEGDGLLFLYHNIRGMFQFTPSRGGRL